MQNQQATEEDDKQTQREEEEEVAGVQAERVEGVAGGQARVSTSIRYTKDKEGRKEGRQVLLCVTSKTSRHVGSQGGHVCVRRCVGRIHNDGRTGRETCRQTHGSNRQESIQGISWVER